MQFNTYTVAGARIAVWLVNHPAPSAAALTDVLTSHHVHDPAATPDDAVALRPWAARLREVFEAGTVAGKAGLADALLIAADCRPRLVSHGPGLPVHLHYAPVRTGLVPRVMALTVAGLAHVIDGGAGARLRCCDRGGCGIAFLDTSRNGRRHFCGVRCANQVNVANHRLRQRHVTIAPGPREPPSAADDDLAEVPARRPRFDVPGLAEQVRDGLDTRPDGVLAHVSEPEDQLRPCRRDRAALSPAVLSPAVEAASEQG